MYTPEYICEELKINLSDVLNIYPYGSKVYGLYNEDSDDDYIIVYKSALLPSGSFKDNAISSSDWKIQGTCYSRGGFIDAINNYQISALECIFLPEEMIIMKKMNFQMNKFNLHELSKKIISTASSSWHFALMSYKDGLIDSAKKNTYHAVRILDFGIQIKENKKITNYSSMNGLKEQIYYEDNFNPKHYYKIFINFSNTLKRDA